MDEVSLFEKYKLELNEDLQLDDFSMKEKQMMMPTIKHKWVGRNMDQRKERDDLKDVRKNAIIKVVEKLRREAVVALSDKSLILKAEEHELIKKIDGKIRDCDHLIAYLEKMEKVLSQATFDIKNVIDIRKLELT